MEGVKLNHDARSQILVHLKQARFLTAKQLAELMPEVRNPKLVADGKTLKPHLIKNRNREMPPTYTRTKAMLKNMAADGLLEEPDRDHPQQAFLWSVKGVKAPENYYNRVHDQTVADLYVKYFNATGGNIYWDVRWPEDDKKEYRIDHYGVNYDARMHLQDKVFFWEVEKGTKDITGDRSLETKVDKYIRFSQAYPDERFTVLLTFASYKHIKALDRLKQTLAMLAPKRRGDQFLVALEDKVLADPLGNVFLSPVDPSQAKALTAF